MQILCGQCGRTTEVDDSLADQAIVCYYCHRQINIDDAVNTTFTELSCRRPEPNEGFASQARQAMEGKLVVACRLCGARLEVPKRIAGKKTRCPACGKEIMISPLNADDTISPPRRHHTPVDATGHWYKPTAAENISRQVPLWAFLLLSAAAGAVAGGIVWILIVK